MDAKTRTEAMLKAIADGDNITLEPKTRLEWWLKKISEGGGSGTGSGGGVPEHTHDWNAKPFGYSVGEGETLYEVEYDEEVTESQYSISEYFLGRLITSIRLYLDDEAYDLVQTSSSGGVTVYSNSEGITITSRFNVDTGGETEFNFGTEKTYSYMGVVRIEESVNKMPIEYIPDELYTEIDNRINAVIEEALGGEY